MSISCWGTYPVPLWSFLGRFQGTKMPSLVAVLCARNLARKEFLREYFLTSFFFYNSLVPSLWGSHSSQIHQQTPTHITLVWPFFFFFFCQFPHEILTRRNAIFWRKLQANLGHSLHTAQNCSMTNN